MDMASETRVSGNLSAKLIKGQIDAPMSWHLKNRLRPEYWGGRLANWAAKRLTDLTGIPTLTSELSAVLVRTNGQRVNFGVVNYRVVTTAFVNFMVDEMQGAADQIDDFKYHDSGVGTTGAAVGDTDIETTDGESRATGSQTEGASANIYKSVGTISYTTTKAITEHGLFSSAASTTLLDRHTFSAINVNNGDSIEFTYELTVSAGG